MRSTKLLAKSLRLLLGAVLFEYLVGCVGGGSLKQMYYIFTPQQTSSLSGQNFRSIVYAEHEDAGDHQTSGYWVHKMLMLLK